jgi:hypothetical protein
MKNKGGKVKGETKWNMLKVKLNYVQGLCISSRNKYGFS